MKRLNKKGFTLVELLAVIVILALIMAIAIYSISGILQSSRESVFKDTGLSVIRGVKNQLLALNTQEEGTYYFTEGLLESNNDLPFGGTIKFMPSGQSGVKNITTSSGATPIYRKNITDSSGMETSCSMSSTASYVNVYLDGSTYVYVVCLIPNDTSSDSVRFLAGKESALMGNTEISIFTKAQTASISKAGATLSS